MRVVTPGLGARARLGRAMEREATSGPFFRALASLWAHAAQPARPLVLPPQAAVVGVGGATLGGSGKTPVVLELSRRLATAGRRVAVVSHGYRTRVRGPRSVAATDPVTTVGDEALELSRALDDDGVPVVVGPRRQEALVFASHLAPCLLVDGLLQSKPARLDASLLVVDAGGPYGCDHCPPAGDLRASPRRLVEASDALLVRGEPRDGAWTTLARRAQRPVWTWRRGLAGLRGPTGMRAGFELLTDRRVGLITTIARPERLISELAGNGVLPRVHLRYADHAEPEPRPCGSWGCNVTSRVDVWLTTEKCVPKIGPVFNGGPVWTIEQWVELPTGLVEWVLQATARAATGQPGRPGVRGEASSQQCSGLRQPW